MYALTDAGSLQPLIDAIASRPVVMLGEASHGTHEYYTWRITITKRLIEEKSFRFIAVEGDWPDCYLINRYVKGYEDAGGNIREIMNRFDRWPTWMWANYARFSLSGHHCHDEVVALLKQVRLTDFRDGDREAALNTEQNALITVNAERYYRSMVAFDDQSWNIRDHHMMETLDRLMRFHGPQAKGIIWEHNTHIGDARATDMIAEGLVNIGQLAREQYGADKVYLVGFGSYSGYVIASEHWGAAMQRMQVPKAVKNSVESLLHDKAGSDVLLLLNEESDERYHQKIKHRAIGVVYKPLIDSWANYVPTVLAERYDAFMFIDYTTALHPLHGEPYNNKTPETFPFGL
ncbi:MAG: erythromycin esterase family protein [Chitinophagaceae bacterium]|nr:MAG: erythromycin esterase family protein [Chitinophagaceae bacterium]